MSHLKRTLVCSLAIFLGMAFSSAVVYHGNINSKIYHEPSCRYYDCKACVKEFTSKEQAEKAGYRACKVCKP